MKGKREREKKQTKIEHWLWCLRARQRTKNTAIRFHFFFLFVSQRNENEIKSVREGRYQVLPYKQEKKKIINWESETEKKNTVTDIRLFFVVG